MAHIHNKAGQWAKSKLQRHLLTTFLFCTAGVGLVSFLFGVFLRLHQTWAASIAFVAIMTFLYVVFRRVGKRLESLGKEGIMYMRGAQAEGLVAWLLKDELDDKWHVFNNIQLKEQSDIDHIVIGPGGVFVMSTKSFRGLFHLSPDGRVFYNNQPTGLIGDTMRQCMELVDRLRALLGDEVPYVQAVLAVPLAWTDIPGRQNNVWVLHKDNLAENLLGAGNRLSKDQVSRVVSAVKMLAESSRHVHRDPMPPDESGTESGSTGS